MRIAEETDAVPPPGQMTLSPWSFAEERMTVFRISVALGTDDPHRALTAGHSQRGIARALNIDRRKVKRAITAVS